jgi:lysylphosphatidylglycerol synthetase-like protein (DUF2156 family)
MLKLLSLMTVSLFSFLILTQSLVNNTAFATCTPPVAESSSVDLCSLPSTQTSSQTLAIVISIFFAVIGAVAVLIIVLAGFRYITSSGKPDEIAKAKDTIIYAAVGIIVCVLAVTIVSFITGVF